MKHIKNNHILILILSTFLQINGMNPAPDTNFYLIIEGQEYILDKDNPLLETSYFLNTRKFAGIDNGTRQNPHILRDINYDTFDAIIKLINNEISLNNFDFEAYLVFAEFIDQFTIINDLENKRHFTKEVNREQLEQFICNLANKLNLYSNNTNIPEHLYFAVQKILNYYNQKCPKVNSNDIANTLENQSNQWGLNNDQIIEYFKNNLHYNPQDLDTILFHKINTLPEYHIQYNKEISLENNEYIYQIEVRNNLSNITKSRSCNAIIKIIPQDYYVSNNSDIILTPRNTEMDFYALLNPSENENHDYIYIVKGIINNKTNELIRFDN